MSQPELLSSLACCRSQPAEKAGVGYRWATPALRVSPSPSPPARTRMAAIMSSLSCCSQCPLLTSRPQSQLSQPDKVSVRVSQFRPADCQWRQELSHSPSWSCYTDFPEVGLALLLIQHRLGLSTIYIIDLLMTSALLDLVDMVVVVVVVASNSSN